MTDRLILLSLAVALMTVSCATGPALPPPVTPRGEDRFLVDPRSGYQPAVATPEDAGRRLEAAWRYFLAADYERARQRLAELRARTPDYAPAALLGAAIDLREGRLDAARHTINMLADQYPGYTAARVYQAELALAEGNTRRAWEIYQSLVAQPDAPALLSERLATAERRLFDELVTAARDAEDLAAIPLLREALTINPGATEARLLLVNRLVGRQQYDEALRMIQPLVGTPDAERDDVQETLAEIEVGRGRYQEAIARYERLARRSPDPHYAQRLEDIKEQWTLVNLPQQYRTALESDAITRADLAVLIYWKLSSVRFASNLPSPPIATDIAEVPGRDEIVRAIAIGLYEVDPVTRRVSPFRTVTASALARYAARLLLLRGASCARGVPAESLLAACRVTDPSATLEYDALVSGRTAARVIDEVDRALQR
ncbi:MAG TPA: tetratricopeptide repeat protein [Thermoanaerobaculia bacterium]|nr:tetratricopeptide repeat protein [Thermoanaerobaculia bacterium]